MSRVDRALAALRRVLRDDAGTALVEYAIVSASLAVMMIAALKLIQSETGVQLTTSAAALTAFAVSPP